MATLQELENAKLVTIDNLNVIKQYIDTEKELTSQDVIQALGYTPAAEQEAISEDFIRGLFS